MLQTSSESTQREEWQQSKDVPVIYNKIFSTGKKYNFQLNSKRNLFASSNFFISATLDKAPPSGTVLHIQVKMLCLLF